MSPLKVTTRDAETGPVLEIVGELDYANAGELRDLLATITLQPGQRFVVDLSRMEFCDSSGITALIAAHSLAQEAQADIVLAGVPANTLRILRIVGLDQIFTLYPDRDSAVRSLDERR
ncbi:STAS domain-containing protein [Streptomyces resistomycificus]|uniref:Anti-sigma factor antagonist n=1 Tax=Streptomyces resistomycificus TaxID=67356 RepID=A0A0L8LWA2_9ACTN|nr:STAS domain-containing protein [Streptomyces resistomycificus]KOG42462.1 anti-anti-sigma factor [Streptomyces resistomycificus]KUN92613.1 anti-anti-sigma factor [Streptomyces resistomycificus]